MDEKDLLKQKSIIEKAKVKLAELKGENNILIKQLNTEFGCDTLIEAKKKIEAYEKKGADIEDKIERLSKKLSEKYD